MPALAYKSLLVSRVADGTKPHTIRGWRRRPFKVGDVLMHYTAMRTRDCRKIRPDTICSAAVPIEVNAHHRYVILSPGSRFYPEGRLSDDNLLALAKRDGFPGLTSFWTFFIDTHGGLLCGQLIEWNPFGHVAGATIEKGEPVAVADNGRVYPLTRTPFSSVCSRPAAAGHREPPGRRLRAPAAASKLTT